MFMVLNMRTDTRRKRPGLVGARVVGASGCQVKSALAMAG
jgi:hypothetical protein